MNIYHRRIDRHAIFHVKSRRVYSVGLFTAAYLATFELESN